MRSVVEQMQEVLAGKTDVDSALNSVQTDWTKILG